MKLFVIWLTTNGSIRGVVDCGQEQDTHFIRFNTTHNINGLDQPAVRDSCKRKY